MRFIEVNWLIFNGLCKGAQGNVGAVALKIWMRTSISCRSLVN